MKYLFILNDPPYGTERSYNGIRLARALLKREGTELRVFLMGDAALCAKGGQKVPEGWYNLGQLIQALGNHGAQIGVCGTCMDARGLAETELVKGPARSTMDELAEWSAWADKVLVF